GCTREAAQGRWGSPRTAGRGRTRGTRDFGPRGPDRRDLSCQSPSGDGGGGCRGRLRRVWFVLSEQHKSERASPGAGSAHLVARVDGNPLRGNRRDYSAELPSAGRSWRGLLGCKPTGVGRK